MSIQSDLLKFFLEDDSSEGDSVRTEKAINKKIRAVKEAISQMMKDGKELKDVTSLLDNALESMDNDITNVKIMTDVADIAAKFQNGIDISAAKNGYHVHDNRNKVQESAKVQGNERDKGSAANAVANLSVFSNSTHTN